MRNIFKTKNLKFSKNIFGSSSSLKTLKCFSSVATKKNLLFEMKTKQFKMINKKHYSTKPGEHAMFCFQCEQTNHGTGCTTKGVCGKTPEVSRLQDLLMHGVKGLGFLLAEIGKMGVRYKQADRFVLNSLFASMTNVNFDDHRYLVYLQECEEHMKNAKRLYQEVAKKKGQVIKKLPNECDFVLKGSYVSQLIEQSKEYGIEKRKAEFGEDYVGMQELIFYGLKGLCAYAEHAQAMEFESDEIYQEISECLQFLTETHTVPEMLEMALKVGALNLKVMDLLDSAHVYKFGNPEPTKFRTSAVKGKCIAISGHDLRDLEDLLKQTEGKGINVYTHGEMLPGNAYPIMKKYKHFIGNYGSAWQNQKFEFTTFPGPIIMTSNCIVSPKPSYIDRIWTKSVVGYAGVKHLENNDFSKVIEQALSLPGFAEDEKETYATTGFGRNSVLSVAGQVVEAVKSGAIKHFFLIGGCDGYETERNYFKDVAVSVPKDSIILTLACGKYRFNKLEFGDIQGIPRLLDMGQCNDAFSAIQVAGALANAFGVAVNQLPLSFVVSWLEQKSVAVLLTLLHLNIQNIRLGTSLPAFVTKNMLKILVDNYKIKPISDPKKDIEEMMLNK